MLFKKQGFPEDSEIVICTVTKVQFHSVFVKIDEYEKSGMIHISEVSAGRIRNLNDYVKVGKKIVCKVLRINMERGHIDLSLRRVSEGQRREKVDELKQEQKAEKILETASRELKTKVDVLYKKVTSKVFKTYPLLHYAFNAVVEDDISLSKDLSVDSKDAEVIEKIVRERIKPKEVIIGEKISIESFNSRGIEIIKSALLNAVKMGCEIKYLGAGSYDLQIKDAEYKSAEGKLTTINSFLEETFKNDTLKIERIEK